MLSFDLTDEFSVNKKFQLGLCKNRSGIINSSCLMYIQIDCWNKKSSPKLHWFACQWIKNQLANHLVVFGTLQVDCKPSWFGCQWVNKLSHLICLLTHWPELWVTRNYSVTIVVCMVSLKKTGCLHVPVVTNKYTWVTFDCLFSSLWSQMNPESESVPSAKL